MSKASGSSRCSHKSWVTMLQRWGEIRAVGTCQSCCLSYAGPPANSVGCISQQVYSVSYVPTDRRYYLQREDGRALCLRARYSRSTGSPSQKTIPTGVAFRAKHFSLPASHSMMLYVEQHALTVLIGSALTLHLRIDSKLSTPAVG